MTNKDIAEMTTKIMQAAVTSQTVAWTCNDICATYKQLFTTIKETVNEKNEDK